MRALLQRVSSASVEIAGTIRGEIGSGLVVLAGFEKSDTREDVLWVAKKLPLLRVFEDCTGAMNRSLADIDGSILLISQFTLFANLKKGNRPSYNRAAPPEVAQPLYEYMIEAVRETTGRPPATGEFGAMMRIALTNEGPVTILLDSQNRGG